MTRLITCRHLAVVGAATFAVAGLAACGDDDESAIAPENQAYCDLATEIDQGGGPPSIELALAARDAAPDDIRPMWDAMHASFQEHAGDFDAVFQDQKFLQNLDQVELWEADHCGPDHADPVLSGAGAGDE